MFRKLVAVAIAAAVLGVPVFWYLTIPETIAPSALASRTPDLGNGRTMFLIGGCSSCHAMSRSRKTAHSSAEGSH